MVFFSKAQTLHESEGIKRRGRRSNIPPLEIRKNLIAEYLENEKRWVTTGEIHEQFPYVKRTLRSTLTEMVEEGLIRRSLSLKDTRVNLYRIAPL